MTHHIEHPRIEDIDLPLADFDGCNDWTGWISYTAAWEPTTEYPMGDIMEMMDLSWRDRLRCQWWDLLDRLGL